MRIGNNHGEWDLESERISELSILRTHEPIPFSSTGRHTLCSLRWKLRTEAGLNEINITPARQRNIPEKIAAYHLSLRLATADPSTKTLVTLRDDYDGPNNFAT